MNMRKVLHLASLALAGGAVIGFIGCGDNSNNSSGSAGQAGNGTGGQGGDPGSGGSAGQTASSSSGSAGQGGGSVTNVPMFVAQGMVGRTIVSCDDGLSWVANRSDDDAYPCFSDATHDCDHHSGAGRGITFGAGYFVATFGWGKPGSIRRSRNGTDWANTLEGKTFAGIVYGNGKFLAGERPPQVSSDDATTWTPGGNPDSAQWNARRTGFAPHAGGRFFLAFESGGSDLNYSDDDGATWKRPTTLPAECAAGMQWEGGFAYGNGVALVLGGNGIACSSKDGGDTWTATNIGTTATDGRLIWDGSAFIAWGRANNTPVRFSSSDGLTWNTTPTMVREKDANGVLQTKPGPSIGAVARSDSGTYVAVNGGWQQWYDKQRFYRSTDGITWDTLDAGKYVGSHPIQFIAFGMGERGGACP